MLLSSSPPFRSWPQVRFLLISSVSFVALGVIYFSSAGAELIKRNYDWHHFQTTSTRLDKGRYVKAESSSSQFNSNLLPQTLFTFTLIPPTQDARYGSQSHSESSIAMKHPQSASASGLTNFIPIAPQPQSLSSSRVRRSYSNAQDGNTNVQMPTININQVQPHHRLRHENKLNNKAIMNKSGFKSRVECIDSSDCVNNSRLSKPKKTPLLPTEECYHTGDVLIVVAITCLLNFSFVLVLWASVRWINYRPRRWTRSKNRHRLGHKRRKWDRDRYCCWDEMSRSDSSSTEEDEDEYEDSDGRTAHLQDNLIVKSYSMEDLRFYHG